MATKKDHSRRGNTENEPGISSPSTSPEPERSGQPGEDITAETVQYVYTVNNSTQQVSKIEEIDPKTGERKELPMQHGYGAATYDPYAGWDSGAGSEYSMYGAGYGATGYEGYEAYPQSGAYPQAAYPQAAYPQAAYPQAAYPQAAYPQYDVSAYGGYSMAGQEAAPQLPPLPPCGPCIPPCNPPCRPPCNPAPCRPPCRPPCLPPCNPPCNPVPCNPPCIPACRPACRPPCRPCVQPQGQ